MKEKSKRRKKGKKKKNLKRRKGENFKTPFNNFQKSIKYDYEK